MSDAGTTITEMPELPFVIVGAGPGGLQLAYFLERSGHDYVVLESDQEIGSFWRRYPRHRRLISFNRVHSIYADPELQLRWDWNSLLTDGYEAPFRDYSQRLYPHAEEMQRYLQDFAQRYALRVRSSSPVTEVSRQADGAFRVRTGSGEVYRCRHLVVATGVGTPYVPRIPGIEHAEGYESVSVDPDDFVGQKVLVIGKGNSAFEVADAILETAAVVHLASPHPIRFAWNTRHPGHVRGHLTAILDTYQLKLLSGILDAEILQIVPEDGELLVSVAYAHADGEQETFCYDRVVRCTGFRFDAGFFDESCRPALEETGRLPAMTSGWESVNVPNLFFAGSLMQARDFRQASSAFIDGFRYNIRTLHVFLVSRAGGPGLQGRQMQATADAMADAVIARISRSSGLWAQFGFLRDVLVVEADQTLYFEELPRDYVFDTGFGSCDHYYTVSLEWGSWQGDVFAIERHPSHATAHTNVFLHPIVRRYRLRELLAEHHVLEDLLGMYAGQGESGFVRQRSGRDMRHYHLEEHDRPLRAFFASQLSDQSPPMTVETS
jgi:thioredoxin reductase